MSRVFHEKPRDFLKKPRDFRENPRAFFGEMRIKTSGDAHLSLKGSATELQEMLSKASCVAEYMLLSSRK